MVPTTPADRLSEVVTDALRDAGLIHDDGTLKAREAERRTGIARNTLARRLTRGDFTLPQLDRIATALDVDVETLVARAKAPAA